MSYLSSPLASDQLVKYLNRDPHVRKVFPKKVMIALGKMARTYAKGLPPDLADDVLSEAWLLLEKVPSSAFDPTRGNAEQYLRLVMLCASTRVRAAYAPPGHPSRIRTPQDRESKIIVVSLEDLEEDEFPANPKCAYEQVEAAHDVSRLLALAPEPLHTALEKILSGMTTGQAANEAGISRFAYARQFAKFQKMVVGE
jgi:hypothetical protein